MLQDPSARDVPLHKCTAPVTPPSHWPSIASKAVGKTVLDGTKTAYRATLSLCGKVSSHYSANAYSAPLR